MKLNLNCYSLLVIASLFSFACKKKVKQKEDTVYSRHLQRQVQLNIISTPPPDDLKKLNVLLVNDGQDFNQLRIKEITDSLYKKKLIKPLLIVGIIVGKREKEYGVANFPDYQGNGDKADKYTAFVDDELISYIKKMAGTRSFESIAIAGFSLGGLSAMDIAWNHADKIDKVGVFSGSFWWRDKDANAADYDNEKNRIMLATIKSSHKRPHLQYWFYAGAKEEESDRDKDGVIDVVDDTKDLITLIQSKNVCKPEDIIYTQDATGKHDYESWNKQLPSFLLWVVGK